MSVLVDIVGKDGLSGPANAAAAALGNVEAAAGRAAGGFQRGIEAAGKLGAALTAIGAAGVVAGLTSAVGAAMSFEKQMSAVGAVAGATAGEMQSLSSLALQLGKETSFSATEAAQGLEELVKAGVSIQDVIGGGAKGALDLAAAGGIAVGEAAEIASNAMNVFSLKGADMAHVADQIAGAANASAISVNDYKFSLSAAGAVAATVGIGFEDLTTAIAAMGNAGIKGSDAGTSLKTLMLGLSPSSKAATAAMRELGIITADGANKFFDASGKAKSMAEIAGVLQEATAGLTQEQKLNALQTMFGTDAIRAAAVMASTGAAGFEELAAQIGKVTAAEVAETRLDNLAGSVEQLKGSLETAAITIGMGITPALKSLADGATGLVNEAMPAVESISKAIGERLPGALQAAGSAAQAAVGWFKGLPAPAQNAAIAFAAVAAAAGPAGMALKALPFLLGAISAPLAALLSPLGLLAVGVAGLAAAWTANLGGIQEKTQTVLGIVGPAFEALGPIVQKALGGDVAGAITDFTTLVQTTGAQLVPLLAQWGTEFVEWIKVAGPPMLAEAATMAGSLLTWIGEQIPPLVTGLAAWGQSFIEWVGPQIPPMLTEAGKLAAGLIGWIGEQVPPLLAKLGEWGLQFVQWIGPQIPPMLAELGKLYLSLLDWMIAQVPGITENLVKWGLLFGAWIITTAVPELIKTLPKIVLTIGEWIHTAVTELTPRLMEFGKNLIIGVWNGIQGAAAEIGPRVRDAIGGWFSFGGGGGGSGATTLSFTGATRASSHADRINRASALTGVPADIIAAIMDTEASGDYATSPAGATGPMQVMPFHARPGEDLRDLDTNVLAGARVLAENYRRFGNWESVAAAYFGAVDAQGRPTTATDAGGMNGINYVRRFNAARQNYASGSATPLSEMQKVSLTSLPGSDPAHWPMFMEQTFEQLPAYLQSLDTIQQAGTTAFETVAQGGIAASRALVSSSTDALGNVITIYTDAGGQMTATITDAAGNIVNQFGTVAESVPALAEQMRDQTLTSVTALGDGTLTTFQDAAGTTIATVTDLAGNVTSQYATMGNGAQLAANGMQEGVLTSVTQLGDGVMTSVQDMAGNVIVTVTDLQGNVVNQYTQMASSAGAAVTGLAQTSTEQFGNVGAAVAGATEPVPGFTSALASIKPPDLGPVVDEFRDAERAAEKAADAAREYAEYLDNINDFDWDEKNQKKKPREYTPASATSKRHAGGPVAAGMPYLVGRDGAEELFVPDRPGHIYAGDLLRLPAGRSESRLEVDRIVKALERLEQKLDRPNITVNGVGLDDVADEIVRREHVQALLRGGELG